MNKDDFRRIRSILEKFKLPLKNLGRFSATQCFEAMLRDKKTLNQQPRFVMLERIGKPVLAGCMHIDESVIKDNIKWMIDDLCIA